MGQYENPKQYHCKCPNQTVFSTMICYFYSLPDTKKRFPVSFPKTSFFFYQCQTLSTRNFCRISCLVGSLTTLLYLIVKLDHRQLAKSEEQRQEQMNEELKYFPNQIFVFMYAKLSSCQVLTVGKCKLSN